MKVKFLLGVFIMIAIGMIFFQVSGKSLTYKEESEIPLQKADKVLVLKSIREMYLMKDGKIFRTYKVALGRSPEGNKVKEGDNKTPEGTYALDWRNDKSSCYKSIHISYPDKKDKERAKRDKVSPGGNIMIHGLHPSLSYLGKGHTIYDWTYGCIAVTDEEMDEIWESVKYGTTIEIRK